ncbi:hypothetical protein [Actinomycetospora chiangmaiensis]|uniref:hypothetical protein n=1 Tax=Actinomycetospora chiangmaiensis TaxID=402650 RepID=UPI0012FAC429|nr:hypothetical protein [Actinomycetospora chiangmaiensis]
MELRLTTHGPTSVVAISLARDADGMPDEVRVVEPDVAAEVEALLEAHRGERVVGVDLDTLVDEAEARVDEARR